MRVFLLALLALALLRVGIGFIGVPQAIAGPATILTSIVFVSVPIFALFHLANRPWTARFALALVVIGMLLQFGLWFLLRSGGVGKGPVALIMQSISQQGLLVWTAGIGGLLACLIKEKNLLIPVSMFLAGFDIFLVLTPMGPTQQILQKAPAILPAVGMSLPKVQTAPTAAPVEAFGYVGPADFLFIAMFFIALFRFEMRTRETLRALVPALLVYLLLAVYLPAIPLLVPIGITVLAVNWRCFNLSRDEWLSTGVLMLLLVGLIGYGATRPKSPPEPLRPEDGRALPESAGSPEPVPGR